MVSVYFTFYLFIRDSSSKIPLEPFINRMKVTFWLKLTLLLFYLFKISIGIICLGVFYPLWQCWNSPCLHTKLTGIAQYLKIYLCFSSLFYSVLQLLGEWTVGIYCWSKARIMQLAIPKYTRSSGGRKLRWNHVWCYLASFTRKAHKELFYFWTWVNTI